MWEIEFFLRVFSLRSIFGKCIELVNGGIVVLEFRQFHSLTGLVEIKLQSSVLGHTEALSVHKFLKL